MEARIKVLYIAGSGRCGSTALGQLLGELQDFVNIGEGRYLFAEQMRRKGIPCECGKPVEVCPFWSPIEKNISRKAIAEITRWGKAKCFLPLSLFKSADRIPRGLRRALSAVEQAYASVVEQSGARVIVDGSKHPTYGLLLACSSKLDVYVLHLVRDARAVAASWRRPKSYLKRRSPVRTTAQWLIYNMFAAQIRRFEDRYLRFSWEAFVSDPELYLRRICAFVETPRVMQGYEKCGAVVFHIDRQHALAGNPDKLDTKRTIELRQQSWHLSRRDRAIVSVLAWPLLLNYGYLRSDSAFGDETHA